MDEDVQRSGQSRTGMLERAMAVLSVFRANDVAVTPATLARRAGLSKATGHRIIKEMVRLRMLEQTAAGMRLGSQMFEIGQLVPRQRVLRQIALPVMAKLREATKLTVHLAILDRTDALYVDILQSSNSLPSRVGGRLPAYAPAVGKAMLAYAPAEVLDAVRELKFRKYGPNTVRDFKSLQPQLASVRKDYFVTETEETGKGVSCVAAPVLSAAPELSFGGPLKGGLSVTGRAGEFDIQKAADAVRSASRTITRIGDRALFKQHKLQAAFMEDLAGDFCVELSEDGG